MIISIAVSAISAADNDTFSTIQNAVDNANDGETVYLNETYYTPDDDANEITINKDLTIDGSTDGFGGVSTIDGNGATRLFTIENCNVNFLNIKFINGNSAANGGAVMVNNSYAEFRDCLFANNSAVNGGAIYHNDQISVDNCTFENNSAIEAGSAIYSVGTLGLYSSVITDNGSSGFAAVYLKNKDDLDDVYLENNIIKTNLVPIYNNGTTISSSTTLVVLNNETNDVPFGNINIWANLYDDSNNTIGSSTPVELEVNGETISATFDAEKKNFNANTTIMDMGEYPVEGTYQYASHIAVSYGALNVTPAKTNIIVTVPNVKPGQTVEGTIKVTASNGDKINGNVTVSINGETMSVTVTNGTGAFTYNKNLTIGNYTVNATFEGNETYTGSVNTTTFSILKLNPSMNVTVDTDSNMIIVFLPKDVDGVVDVEIAGQTLSVKVIGGIGGEHIPALPAGEYTLKATFDGNDEYNAETVQTTFTIASPVIPGDKNTTNGNNTNGKENGENASEAMETTQSDLETGNPIALLLLALLTIPVRRLFK